MKQTKNEAKAQEAYPLQFAIRAFGTEINNLAIILTRQETDESYY